MSKNKALKQVGRLSFIPALFGINEPILFGAPIVLNPMFFIPFVICGGVKVEHFIIPKYIAHPPNEPIILSILIWYPFVKS